MPKRLPCDSIDFLARAMTDAAVRTRQVRHAFSRAAAQLRRCRCTAARSRGAVAGIARLSGRSRNRDRARPGLRSGRAAAAMRERWPNARVLALDLACRCCASRQRGPGIHCANRSSGSAPTRARCRWPTTASTCCSPTCACNGSRTCRRCSPGSAACSGRAACCWCRVSGPDTLHELRAAFAHADIVRTGAARQSVRIDRAGRRCADAAGFRNPVLDRDATVTHYADLPALMRELRAIGATNALRARRHTLTGKSRFARAAAGL